MTRGRIERSEQNQRGGGSEREEMCVSRMCGRYGGLRVWRSSHVYEKDTFVEPVREVN